MQRKNLSLIGMAGCGKSTVGVLLAKALNMGFIDTDLVIQQTHGKLLCQILAEDGIDIFKRKEAAAVCSLDCGNTCIATGGSVVYDEGAMAHLKAISRVIFINLPYDVIEQRLSDIKSRGVVIEQGRTLRDLYNERQPLYLEYADCVIDARGKGVEELVSEIMAQVSAD